MPFFSIITPVFNTPRFALEECIASVIQQTDGDWELILIDDASPEQWIAPYLRELEQRDPRVKVLLRESNGGIVAASNDGVNLATGEFIVLLDHDDLLEITALGRVRQVLESDGSIDYVYTDEDKVNEAGEFVDRFNKPRWSPERLRGQNYCTHLSVIRTDLLRTVGAFRAGFDGSQDYDLILRVTEQARKIVHIPEVLYHWRVLDGSAAKSTDAKPYAYPAAVKAVSEHLERLSLANDVHMDDQMLIQRRPTLENAPLVSVVIPTGGTVRRVWGNTVVLVEQCVRAVLERSSYPNIEVIVVADAGVANDVLERLDERDEVTIVEYSRPFNFSEKINIGSRYCNGEILLSLNDDVIPVNDDWLEHLVMFFEESDVAVVGPMLLLEDFTIQSAGHFFHRGVHEAAHARSASESGRFGLLNIPSERSSVTFAAAAIRRSIFESLGGLNIDLPGAYNDVDFCNKVVMRGMRVVWTPHSQAVHFESASRSPDISPSDTSRMSARWASQLRGPDPYLRLFDLEMSGLSEYDEYEQWLRIEPDSGPLLRPSLTSVPTVSPVHPRLTHSYSD